MIDLLDGATETVTSIMCCVHECASAMTLIDIHAEAFSDTYFYEHACHIQELGGPGINFSDMYSWITRRHL